MQHFTQPEINNLIFGFGKLIVALWDIHIKKYLGYFSSTLKKTF